MEHTPRYPKIKIWKDFLYKKGAWGSGECWNVCWVKTLVWLEFLKLSEFLSPSGNQTQFEDIPKIPNDLFQIITPLEGLFSICLHLIMYMR